MCWRRHSLLQKQIYRKRAVKNHLYKKTAPARNGGAALMETEN
jgi:hypothetical protein